MNKNTESSSIANNERKPLESEQSSYIWVNPLTNQNCVREEIKKSLNSENACCHLALNVLSPRFL